MGTFTLSPAKAGRGAIGGGCRITTCSSFVVFQIIIQSEVSVGTATLEADLEG